MFKRNQLYVSLVAASLVMATSASVAQETATSSTSVTLQNAFDFSENSGLSFGTIRAEADITVASLLVDVGSYVVNADGTSGTVTGGTDADMAVLAAGAPAQYSIANASAFSPISLTVAGIAAERTANQGAPGQNTLDPGLDGDPALTADNINPYVASVSLTNSSAPSGNPEFDVDDFTVLEAGSATVQTDAAAFSVTTDLNGAVDFAVGATIFTDTDATSATYTDGTYSGTFVVSAQY